MDDGCWTRMISGEEVKSDWIFGYILKTELSECAYWIRHWMCRRWTDQGGLQSLSWATARIKFAIYSYGKCVRGLGLVRWWGSGLSLRYPLNIQMEMASRQLIISTWDSGESPGLKISKVGASPYTYHGSDCRQKRGPRTELWGTPLFSGWGEGEEPAKDPK